VLDTATSLAVFQVLALAQYLDYWGDKSWLNLILKGCWATSLAVVAVTHWTST